MDGLARLSLVFGIHCHQPVGTPDAVVDRAADECYLPFLSAAADHPEFKFCAHFSGALLRPLELRRPKILDLLKSLVGRGQLEILGGGFYDPILPILTETDRAGQIRRFGDYLQRVTGQKPKGMWLAERVWDPQLCRPMAETAVKFVMLDDRMLIAAGVAPADVHGTFLTEESGHSMTIFPIHERLRYLIPDETPAEIMAYLESIAAAGRGGPLLLTFMDDGEKFGAWPGTHPAMYQGRRLEQIFKSLAQASFLRLVTPSEWMANHAPRGLQYVPPSASAEMSESVLPHLLQEEFGRFKSEVDRHPRAAIRRLFLPGGYWKSFLTKYPESNWMQKRVFTASQKMGPVLEKLGADREARTIRDLLDRATCHDAYWHGASGGLYRPNLRRAVYENLLEAENRFSKKMGLFPACFMDDLDTDGQSELIVYTEQWVIGFKPALGGAMVEWSWRPAHYNFQNTITRRPESYHARSRQGLIYDRYLKGSGLIYALDPQATFRQFVTQTLPELLPADGAYDPKVEDKAESFGIRMRRETDEMNLEKCIVISKRESSISIKAVMDRKSAGSKPAVLGLGLDLFYGSAEDVSIRVGDSAGPAGLEGEAVGRRLEIADRWSGTRLTVAADRDIRFWMAPSVTISKSESAIEKIFQGISLLLLADPSGSSARQELNLTVEVNRYAGTEA